MFPPFLELLGLCFGRNSPLVVQRLNGAPTLALSNYVQEILIEHGKIVGSEPVLRINLCCA